jgi:hypothetical protein
MWPQPLIRTLVDCTATSTTQIAQGTGATPHSVVVVDEDDGSDDDDDDAVEVHRLVRLLVRARFAPGPVAGSAAP